MLLEKQISEGSRKIFSSYVGAVKFSSSIRISLEIIREQTFSKLRSLFEKNCFLTKKMTPYTTFRNEERKSGWY